MRVLGLCGAIACVGLFAQYCSYLDLYNDISDSLEQYYCFGASAAITKSDLTIPQRSYYNSQMRDATSAYRRNTSSTSYYVRVLSELGSLASGSPLHDRIAALTDVLLDIEAVERSDDNTDVRRKKVDKLKLQADAALKKLQDFVPDRKLATK